METEHISDININTITFDLLYQILDNKSKVTKIITDRDKNGIYNNKRHFNIRLSNLLSVKEMKKIYFNTKIDYGEKNICSQLFITLPKNICDKIYYTYLPQLLLLKNFNKEGWIYVLKYDGDKTNPWYKIGYTSKKTSEERTQYWNYTVKKTYKVNNNPKIIEKIIHLFLNPYHITRKAIHGEGKTEIEWFYLKLEYINKVICEIIDMLPS